MRLLLVNLLLVLACMAFGQAPDYQQGLLKKDTSALRQILDSADRVRFKDSAAYRMMIEQVLAYAESWQEKRFMAIALKKRAALYREADKAVPLIDRGLKYVKEVKDTPLIISLTIDLAYRFSLSGQEARALDHYLTSLKLLEKKMNERERSIVYNNIGAIYMHMEDPKALDYLLKGFPAPSPQVDSMRLVTRLMTLGAAYNMFGNNSEAIRVTERAKFWADKSTQASWQWASRDNLSRYLLEEAEKEQDPVSRQALINKAKDYVYHNQELLPKIRIPGIIANIHYVLGKAYFQEGNYQLALSEGLKGLKVGDELGEEFTRWSFYLNLSKAYEKTGKFDSAYYFYYKHTMHKDSFDRKSPKLEIAKKRFEYEYGKISDSLFQLQLLTEEKLKQQSLLARQKEQALALNEALLALSNEQKNNSELAFQKANAELLINQARVKETEKQLIISGQEKELQARDLQLQKAQLELKERDLKEQKSQKLLYLGGLGGSLLVFGLLFYNIRNRQKAAAQLHAQKMKTHKAETERRLAEFEMHGLRAQLNPHFMFNSLNAIQRQILEEDNENALLYLNNFAKMLRQLLENAEQPFLPLEKELGFIRHYLSMEQLRMPEMEYEINIDPELDTVATTIPNMILQPYLENAIWHGLSTRQGRKLILIHAYKEAGGTRITIEDNGIGRKKAYEIKSQSRTGHRSRGMELLQKRFELIKVEYGSQVNIEVEDLEENGISAGTRVSLFIPDVFPAPAQSFRLEQVQNN